MAQNIINIGQAKILNALDTYNHTALTSNMYMVAISVTEQPPSGLSVVIKQNGTTKATAALPAASQNHVDLQVVLNCVANDVIAVVLSSSSAIDNNINVLRGTLNIHIGSS